MNKLITGIFFQKNYGNLWITQRTPGPEGTWEYTGRLITSNENKTEILIHTFLYYLQTNQEIPYKHNWNKEFFQNSFEKPVQIPSELSTLSFITREVKEGRLVRLAEDNNENNSKKLGIRNIVGAEFVYPKIIDRKRLVYRNKEDNSILSLGPEDVFVLSIQMLNKMSSEKKPERNVIGIIYSFFPFKDYEKRLLIK